MAKSARKVKRGVVGLLVATSIASGILGLSFGKAKLNVPSYQAVRIIDGDTFETEEKQWIRLSGIDAPEKGFCGYNEAKKELEKLVIGKDLYIKVVYHDSTRLMGLVYNNKGLVATQMLASGWAEFHNRENVDFPEMGEASNTARDKKLGLFSKLCTQEVNPKDPTCDIKGNRINNNTATYHLPGCSSYVTSIIQLHHGDQWFCTEGQAQKAGFVKAKTCY